MRTIDTSDMKIDFTQEEVDEINSKFDWLERFMRDLIENPSLTSLLPDADANTEGGPIFDIVAPGSRPDAEPDIRTPYTDVYITGYHTAKPVYDFDDN